MTPAITMPFRIGTEAVRRCAGLRRQTAGLRAAMAAAHRVKAAGARFPLSVFGGELLGLMSQQFRDLLTQPNGRRNAAYGRDARREFGEPGATARGDAPWTGTTSEKSPPAEFEAGGTDVDRAPFGSNGGAIGQASGMAPASGGPEGWRRNSAWESVANGDVSPFSWPGAPSRASKAGPAAAPSPMEKELREYWELERRDAASRQAVSRAAETRDTAHRVAEIESRPAAEALRFGQTTFAQRLQAFVSGNEPREHTARAPWRVAAESAPDALGPRTISEPTAGTALFGDFAVQLADTLRSQATHHGIDLT